MIEFSAPLPFNIEHIDYLYKSNLLVNKSRITSLYSCLPINSDETCGFEQSRVETLEKMNFKDLAIFINYAKDKGFEFVYLINSPKPFDTAKEDLNLQLDKLSNLLLNLKKIGCSSLRVTNTQLILYISNNFPEFKIYASTSQEYFSIKQYQNLFKKFSNIKEVLPSVEQTKNFLFLKNFRKLFPNIDVELILNEACMGGCPFRVHHSLITSSLPLSEYRQYDKNYLEMCTQVSSSDVYLYICRLNTIYPWDIFEYTKIGVNKFKFVGRNAPIFRTGAYMKIYRDYMLGVDNPSYLDKMPFRYLNHYIVGRQDFNYTVEQIRPYLPSIKHFLKNGHLCHSMCGIDCLYCYNCADKMRKKYPEMS